jgi:hypothetical protein
VSAAGLLGQLWRPFPKDVSGFLPHIRGVSAALIGKTQHKQLTQVEKPADDPARPRPIGAVQETGDVFGCLVPVPFQPDRQAFDGNSCVVRRTVGLVHSVRVVP